ncbi:MAG: glycosyltransferase [Lachnospiraceae bacterium]|nr:glycosyltransferase [Lachnospiraceae bacterium]
MSDKRKLLLIVPTLHQGGQERVVVRSARLLADEYDVTIAIFDDSDIGYDTDGLNIVNLNVPSASWKLFKAVNVIRRCVKLKKLKTDLKPDISYSHGGTASIVNCITATPDESTWVSVHSYFDVTYAAHSRLYAKRADLVVCCSHEIEKAMRSRYGISNTATLYNLYDRDELIAEGKREEPDEPLPVTDASGRRIRYIMAMGRDDDHKMFWHMIKAFKLINIVIPETRLLILGAGEYDAYKRMVLGLGLEDEVTFAGMHSNPFKYLKYGEVIWLTSRIEGFPNSLVEGMAMGLAGVSTNCPSGPAEILVEDGDTLQCAEQFEQMEDRDDLKVIYGEYGVLTPAMEFERDMDFAHITEEHFNLAEVMIELLRNEEKLRHYREAASKRAGAYGYEQYRDRFNELVSKYVQG